MAKSDETTKRRNDGEAFLLNFFPRVTFDPPKPDYNAPAGPNINQQTVKYYIYPNDHNNNNNNNINTNIT